MKRIMIVTLLTLFAVSLYAGDKENLNYIKTGGKTYFGCQIKAGIFNTRIITTDGKRVKVANQNIEAMVSNGRLYQKLPVICKNNVTDCMALMEYITSKDGMRLYRHTSYNGHYDLANGIIEKAHPEFTYFIFKDGKFHLRVDANNAETVLPFFGIEVIL
jgi:hypothetical protein